MSDPVVAAWVTAASAAVTAAQALVAAEIAAIAALEADYAAAGAAADTAFQAYIGNTMNQSAFLAYVGAIKAGQQARDAYNASLFTTAPPVLSAAQTALASAQKIASLI
jgi:hypothetical protein